MEAQILKVCKNGFSREGDIILASFPCLGYTKGLISRSPVLALELH